MQKLHKSKTPKVYKNKKLNNANFGTYNLNDYQVFLQLVTKLGKVDESGTYKQPQTLERKHILTAKEFSQAFNVDINTTYRVLKTAGKKLARTAITLEKPDLFVTQEIPICSFAEYNNKEGSLTIEFNEHIMPYLAQVKQKFVLYNLKEIANFGSLYSTRLYELIQEFKDTGHIIKSVAQLREIFAVGKKFPDYNNFKRYTFAHATDEINAQYEMNLRFEEIKEGRKVVSIRFEFNRSHTTQGYNPATKQMVNVTVKPKRKKTQDNETPAPQQVHTEQQELQLETPKTKAKGIKMKPQDFSTRFTKSYLTTMFNNAEKKAESMGHKIKFKFRAENNRWVVGYEVFFNDKLTGFEKSFYIEDYLETMFHWHPKLSMHESNKENIHDTTQLQSAFNLLTDTAGLSVDEQRKISHYVCDLNDNIQYFKVIN
jgi:plasmid replication initiation protein